MANGNVLNPLSIALLFIYWFKCQGDVALLSGLDIAEDLSSILCLLSSQGVFFPHFNYLLPSSVVAFTHRHLSYQKEESTPFRMNSLPPSVLTICKSRSHHCTHYLECPWKVSFKAPRLPFRVCRLWIMAVQTSKAIPIKSIDTAFSVTGPRSGSHSKVTLVLQVCSSRPQYKTSVWVLVEREKKRKKDEGI